MRKVFRRYYAHFMVISLKITEFHGFRLKFSETSQAPADTTTDIPQKPKRRPKYEPEKHDAETASTNEGVSASSTAGEMPERSGTRFTENPTTSEETANPQMDSKLKQDQTRLNFEQGESVDNGGSAEATPQDAEQLNEQDVQQDPSGTNDVPPQSDPDSSSETDGTATAETPPPSGTTSDKSGSKLQFAKEEKQIGKLEKKADKYEELLEKARDKLPTKTVKKKELIFDEDKGKAVSKLTHETEVIPIGEAKWNNPKKKPLATRTTGKITSMAVTKVHAKIHQVEHENVGVKAAHQAELLGESASRGVKKTAYSAYRFHKNKPYRKVAKLEQKSIKNKMRLDYKKALRDNPKLKSSPISRFFQKRAIKRNYAKDLRNAKNAATTAKASVGFVARAGKVATAIIRRNPVFLIKAGLLLLVLFLIMSLVTMCASMFQGGAGFIGAVTYAAEYEDIDAASVLYTELETDLRIYIQDIQTNHPGFDEYRLNIGSIGHNPFELMAFLTAVYQDFTFAEVETTIREIFAAQYNLELTLVVEIRTRTETRTGSGTNPDGTTYSYTYTVIVEYEWHILYVTLTSRPLSAVLAERMTEEQAQHYNILMYSHGARQFIGNPFDFNWLPYFTSPFGYRVHPISGGKQFHWGIDIGLPQGTPIRAGIDGTIIYVGYHPNGYGNIVIIESADGIQARYAHCHEVFVTTGQTVERGDIIATVGTTGASTGPHLHMEVAINGRRINPIFFVEFRN